MKNKGFTLIELLIVVGILAVLITAVAVALNPAKQFAKANNARRWADITNIMNAISQNIVDHQGVFDTSGAGCGGDIPTTTTSIASKSYDSTGYDLCGCIVPGYIGSLPTDPAYGSPAGGVINCTDSYHTEYTIKKDATSGRITITAPRAQDEGTGTPPTISIVR
jgi:type IV pilus assembly protein PilA